jgi:hypothetical protein
LIINQHVTTITFGHHSGRLLAAGSEDSIIYVYKINPITSLFVRPGSFFLSDKFIDGMFM